MLDSIQKFEDELGAFLEFAYNSSKAPDSAQRFNDTEKAAFDFMDRYLLNSEDLIAGDLEGPAQRILESFLQSKIR
ncbi:hypothetical protein [Flavobacterium sp. SORGH_AS_0622]|uniref:hypothetical protein n=1 Tax=Flavobacterium sp. SORGH_AS_0622 TaxID=3041772 RepID=UPI00278265B6|nr:hypothetical protein [Flavobacterium sp. SORGH_AS_0622]MDQ1165640.1 hypothetical protein [Flavobacterium sp. SORGH_AS_0622]